jgi:SAM-dependent methyltransferase
MSKLAALVPAKARPVVRAIIGRPAPSVRAIPSFVPRYCTGQGIEIGAGKHPYCSPANTVFLDRHTDNKDGTPNPDMISDAGSIPRPDCSFDFLLSAHCLEHVPNTIKTLNEWIRVLKPGGALILILPHADRTFDHLRGKTTLEHHIRDYEAGIVGPDRSHIEEIEAGWRPLITPADEAKYERQWGAKCWDWDFRFANDVVHYHVWTQDEIVRLLQYLGMQIVYVAEEVPERTDSFVVIARKV